MKYCIKCGKQINDDLAFCPSCGASQNASKKDGQFDEIYKVDVKYTPNDILRYLLVAMSLNDKAPVDLVDANFNKFELTYSNYLGLTIHSAINYKVEIGYDREEQYWDTESEYCSEHNRWEERRVLKTRIVTDWEYLKDYYEGEDTGLTFNETPENQRHHTLCLAIINTLKPGEYTEGGDFKIAPDALKRVTSVACGNVINQIRFPGDRTRNFTYKSNDTVKSLVGYQIPRYVTTFTYNNKLYSANGYACGPSIMAFYALPENNPNLKEGAKDQTKTDYKLMVVAWSLYAVVFLASMFAMIFAGLYWLFIPVIAMEGLAIFLHATYNKKYYSILKDSKAQMTNLRYQKLEDTLARLNLPSLNDEEKQYFDGDQVSSDYVKENKMVSFPIAVTLCSIATAILTIIGIVMLCIQWM